MKHKWLFITLALLIAAFPLFTASAADPCPEGEITGTVVGVDELFITLDIDETEGEILCTIEVEVMEDMNPITMLLGEFFSGVVLDSVIDAFDAGDEVELSVTVDGDGKVIYPTEDIQTYHDEGLGYGVLVKLYVIADRAGIDVQELVDKFLSGVGMGELFEEYGKPSIRGVGHVRHADKMEEKHQLRIAKQCEVRENGKKPKNNLPIECPDN